MGYLTANYFYFVMLCMFKISVGTLTVSLEVTTNYACEDGSHRIINGENFKLECIYGSPRNDIAVLTFYRNSDTIIDYPNAFQAPFSDRATISYTDTSSIVEITASFDVDNNDNTTYRCLAEVDVNGNLETGQSEIVDITSNTSDRVPEAELLDLLEGADDRAISSSVTVTVSANSQRFGCRPPTINNVTQSDQSVCTGSTSGTTTTCEISIDIGTFNVDEVKTYTVYTELFGTPVAKNFRITRNEATTTPTTTDEPEPCDCCTYANGLFIGPTLIVPLSQMTAQTIMILIFIGIIPACCKCTKRSKLFQLKVQSVIQLLICLLDISCTIAIGVAYGCNKNQPDHCNCEDESPTYMVIVSPIIAAIYIAFLIVEVFVVPRKIPDDKPEESKPSGENNRNPERNTSKKHHDLPEGVAVRDPLTPRKLPPIGKSY